MEGSFRMSTTILVTFLVFGVTCGHERRVLRSLDSTVRDDSTYVYGRIRRQAPPFPSSRNSNDQFIPRIEPPPPGSILTYDGKPISTSVGAFNIVPKSERRTPSINRNRPQYVTFRGELPPPIPDVVPRDLPQFKDSKSIASGFPSGFQNN